MQQIPLQLAALSVMHWVTTILCSLGSSRILHACKFVSRLCRIANCPRVPKHIRSEIEEIYSKGPVEAALKLANNALQLRLAVPIVLHAPSSTAGPGERYAPFQRDVRLAIIQLSATA